MSRGSHTFPERNPYEVGSQPPSGYVHWHEWAAAQHKGGLRQKQCPVCSLWKFPQEACKHEPQSCDAPQDK